MVNSSYARENLIRVYDQAFDVFQSHEFYEFQDMHAVYGAHTLVILRLLHAAILANISILIDFKYLDHTTCSDVIKNKSCCSCL